MRIERLAVAALVCASIAAAAAPEKKMNTVLEWKSQQGGRPQEGHEVASDAHAWARVWKSLGQDAPALDFKKFVGVVVFVGERPTGGYTVVFDEPAARGEDLVVRYRIPKPTGFTTQAFTHPWKAKAFPRPKGKVVVEAAAP